MTRVAAARANKRLLAPFPEGWYLVTTRNLLNKQLLMQRTWMGHEIVVWLDAIGRACIALSFCPHMGSQLGPDAGARVRAGRLVCPFHGFEFDASGKCVDTPSGAPARSANLHMLEVHEIDGLIFGWCGIDGRPPQWRLPDSPDDGDEWTSFQIRTIRFPGHPQETSENSVDIAHLSYVHGYFNVTNESPVLIEGPRLVSRFGFSTIRKFAKFAQLKLDVAAVAHVIGLGYSFVEFQELSIGIDARLWVCATPVDGELLDLTVASKVRTLRNPKRRLMGLGFLPTRMRAPILNKFIADLQIRDVQQDTIIWSRKQYLPRPRLVRTDGDILAYRAYCTQFYPDAEHHRGSELTGS